MASKRTYEEMVAAQKKLGPTGPSGPIVNPPVSNPVVLPMDTTQVDSTVLNTPAVEPGGVLVPNSIIRGLREDYPDLADFPNDILVEAVRQADFEDMDEDTYFKALAEAYPDTTAPAASTAATAPSLGSMVKALPGQIASAVKEDVVAPATAVSKLPAGEMAGTLSELESMPDYQAMLARGYTPRTAKLLMEQRISTMQDIAGTMQQEAAAGQEAAARGAAAYGSAALTGLAGPGMAAQPLIKAAQTGAVGLGAYGGIKAAGEGKSAAEVFHDTLVDAGVGGVLGPVLHPIFGRVAKTLGVIGNIPRYVEEGMAVAQGRLNQRLGAAVDAFVQKFQGEWLRSRFSDMPVVANESVHPNVAAASIIARVLGRDAAENASESAVGRLADKITRYRRYSAIDPSIEPRVTPDMPAPMEGLEAPGASLANPLQQQPITPRQALDAVIEAGKLNAQVASEPMVPQAPRTGLVPEPAASAGQMAGFQGAPQPAAPVTPQAMQGLELQPPSAAAAPEPIVPEVRPTIPSNIPPAEVPAPAPRGEGGVAPEPNAVLPTTPAFGEQTPPFTPPSGVKPTKGLERIPPPSRAQSAPMKLEMGTVKPEQGYAYHATNADRLHQIAESGELQPHKPWFGTEQEAWPDGSKAVRSYFMEGENVKNIMQFAPAEGTPVVIRIKSQGLMKEKGTGDMFTNKRIPISRIEYLDDTGHWVPLKKGS